MSEIEDTENVIRVGISHGDINGIGYEVIIKAFRDPRILELFTPVVYGSSKAASYHRKAINLQEFSFNIIKSAEQISPLKANLINCCEKEIKIELGKSRNDAGELALQSLEEAIAGLKNNDIQILVTAPINKHNIQSEGFKFPGHTEYLAEKFGNQTPLMLMVCDSLRLGVITGHIPLKDVSATLTVDLIMEKVRIMNNSLKVDFGIRKPKIALLGLNPHAGDEGLLGSEDLEVIVPAIKKAFEEDILAYGPYPADGFFGSQSYKNFDGVLAMYHDQGLIAFKTLAFESGVNYTAGLSIVRTSPAHGTAYDIAGKNMASSESFTSAIYLGIEIYKNRLMHQELTKNPLITSEQETNNSAN